MPFATLNPISPADVSVLGLQIHGRIRTLLTADALDTDTEIEVGNARFFRQGALIRVGSVEAEVASVSGNTITLAAALGTSVTAGAIVRYREFIDFGHVQNPDPATDQDEQTVESARTGKRLPIKRIITSITKTMGFETLSATDPFILSIHKGSPQLEGAVTGSNVFRDDANPVEMELLMLLPNAETGGKEVIVYRPIAEVLGNGEEQGDGENPAVLTFQATFTADDTYTPPTAVIASGGPMPLGVVVTVPQAGRQTVLDAFADA